MKTILVIGGAGFIGSNLCEALLERGDSVTCLDNFATGHTENLLPLVHNELKSLNIDSLKTDNAVVYGVKWILRESAGKL